MGLALSCPGDDAFDQGFEALITRSFRYDSGSGNVKSTRSVSFNGRASEPAAAILKAFGSGKLVIEGSLSFKREDTSNTGADPNYQLETKISIKSPKGNPMRATYRTSRFSPSNERVPPSPVPDCPKHRAAVKLQKVYKSFRTRRQLADCAVLIEQRWWKLLDFALLKQSSVSFYDIEEPESVVSRWLRARRRAATVGKGLSKDEKAQKLALQHWLEAIDPRHRYGHNLHFYYDCWLRCESNQPFFYWLDVGDGREVNLDGQCPRSKLQKQCIKYLGPKEREVYEVIVEDAKFLYKRTGKLLDTSEGPKDSKWIFVLSTSKTLYVGQKKKGNFQHSSFLAGGATSAAGRLVVESGILKAVWPHSGHYRPTEENFQEFMTFLKENNVDLTEVTLSPTEDDAEMLGKSISSEQDGTQTNFSAGTEAGPKRTSSLESFNGGNNYCTEFKLEGDRAEKRPLNLPQYQKVLKKIPKDKEEGDDEATKIPSRFLKSKLAIPPKRVEHKCSHSADFQLLEDSPISEEHYKPNLFSEEEEEDEDASVPEELIFRRIKSKKAVESYQLGKQLSCKWTTGAGPRIGWVRDYPSELQFRSLEQVHLSPRTERPYPSPRIPLSPSLRIPDLAFARKVPLLQKPNIRR